MRQRSTAEKHRATVMLTAVKAFAERGYYGTSTSDVAQAAGISQSYLYRLFPNKETLFAALIDHCSARLREAVAVAAATMEGADPERTLRALATAYDAAGGERDALMVLMHAVCSAGEPMIGESVRGCYVDHVEYIREVSGASNEQIHRCFAHALLGNLAPAVGGGSFGTP
ncbi:TetR/AcrR family transcriptional regulator [Wenjunlia tyrosinilytica]|nr:TetR family transcriptional regulator [Wenjunlia tyrosinilytica]